MDDTGRNAGCFDSHDQVVTGRIDMVTEPTGRRKWPDEVKGLLVAEIYQIESEVRGLSADERRAIRRARSTPLVDAFGDWVEEKRARASVSTQ